jgi:hypothetical protein
VTDDPIHIAREGRSLGRFAPEDVVAGLREGRFLPTDLCWREPMPDWVLLSEFKDLAEIQAAAPESLETPPPPRASTPDLPVEPAWERRSEMGWLQALTMTLSGVLTKPERVFSAMPDDGRPAGALWFYLLLTTITGWVAIGYQYVAARVNPETLGEPFLELMDGNIDLFFVMMAVALPIANLLSAFFFPFVFQISLRVLVNRPLKFARTFRVFCYAWGVASLLQILPICGGYAYLGYAIYLTVAGLRDVHRIPALAASLAVIPPTLLCRGALMALAVGGGVSGG